MKRCLIPIESSSNQNIDAESINKFYNFLINRQFKKAFDELKHNKKLCDSIEHLPYKQAERLIIKVFESRSVFLVKTYLLYVKDNDLISYAHKILKSKKMHPPVRQTNNSPPTVFNHEYETLSNQRQSSNSPDVFAMLGLDGDSFSDIDDYLSSPKP